MRLLLDTHVLLWWHGNSPKLLQGAREAIQHPGNRILVSVASAWEIGIKRAIGKLKLSKEVDAILDHYKFACLPIELSHARAAGELPRHHNDPFDRMLVAQAQIEGLVILTRDREFKMYDVATLLA